MKKRKWGDLYTDDNGQKAKWYPVHEGQADILISKARFRAIISGISGGKTSCGALDYMHKIQENPKGIFLMVGPTFNVLKSATIPTLESTLEGTPYHCTYQPGNFRFDLPTGGVIYVRSGDAPDSFEGIQVSGAAWLDEGGQVSTAVWHAIRRRTGLHKAPVLITTTPYPKYRWLKTEFIDRYNEGNPLYFVRQFPSIANPLYDKAEYESAKAELPEWKFRMFYQAEFCGAIGLVYPEMEKCFVDMPPDGLPSGTLYGGIDWGGGSQTSDPFSALVGVLDDNDVLWVFYERYVTGEKNDLIQNANAIKDWTNVLEQKTGQYISTWWADASRPSSISLFRRMANITIRKAKNQPGSIASGIDLVTSRMRTGRLKIIKSTVTGLKHESELYRYQTDEEEQATGDTPRDKHNHAMDALRYMVMGIDARKTF